MTAIESFREIALSFPGVEEHPHFDKPSFRFKKKIFATLWEKEQRGMVRLSIIDQSVFCSNEAFYPVPGGWGRQGATFVDLLKVKKGMLKDALMTAYKSIK